MGPSDSRKRILIIGGVAGGASCATRARRLCERCEIVVFDRGEHVSFANCGLPYYVGDVIPEESKLLIATPQLFKDRFNIAVELQTEVTSIDRARRVIEVRNLKTGEMREERYDALVISTGAIPIIPDIHGIDLPGIHVVRTIPDSRRIRNAVQGAKHALVVGGGMIGLEMAENLVHRGLEVTLVELAPQVLPILDQEMAHWPTERLMAEGVELRLGQSVVGFERTSDQRLSVALSGGDTLKTDLVILGIGVKPHSGLARDAGLQLGSKGSVVVDAAMRTEDPHIWAVGDVVASHDIVTGLEEPIPLAGPANRQGRVAASSIIATLSGQVCQQNSACLRFRGVQATAVCGIFGLTVAATGASERMLRRMGRDDFEKVYLHPGNHASYFPDAKPIHMKLIYRKSDGLILGAQAIGEADVARRIDVIAMAIQLKGTVFDLEEAELCYAPQFGAAKDPVNMAGMIAGNELRGDLRFAPWEQLFNSSALILDVRSHSEFESGHIEGALNIPLEDLRERVEGLEIDREIWLVCGVGQRAYYAQRILRQRGLNARILSGGMQTYEAFWKGPNTRS